MIHKGLGDELSDAVTVLDENVPMCPCFTTIKML